MMDNSGKGTFLPLLMAFLMIGSIFVILISVPPPKPEGEPEPEFDIGGKALLIVVAPTGFNETEFLAVHEYALNSSGNVSVATISNDTAVGASGSSVPVNFTLSEANVSLYDAVVFIGGSGLEPYLNDSLMKAIAVNASQEGVLVGAICIAPCILANAGVLNGQKATVFPSQENIALLQEKGATYVEQDVVRYGNTVTANGPSASISFARKLMQILEGE